MEYCPSLGDALECPCIENLYFFSFLLLNLFECVTDDFVFHCSSPESVLIQLRPEVSLFFVRFNEKYQHA